MNLVRILPRRIIHFHRAAFQNSKKMSTCSDILEDFLPGPLDAYRKDATFDWKKLMVLVEGEDVVRFKIKVWKFYENDPLFKHVDFSSLDEERRVSTLRAYRMLHADLFSDAEMVTSPHLVFAKNVAMFQYCPSLAIKFGLTFDYFKNVLLTLGNDSHMKLYGACNDGEVAGSFALTEIGHGTNTKGIKTYATFDIATQQYILNTPSFDAAKCWSGALGKCATHSIIWARLVLPDGTDQGLHAFVTPIRDPETGTAFPGVVVGDMGRKSGLNGVDNGFVLFKHYRIPKDCLLNKTGDVTPDGKYVSPYKSKQDRTGASFGVLSGGRVGIIQICIAYLTKSMAIAVRYAAVRKQFGPSDHFELAIIEYQLIQWRLFPHLAAAYCLKIFGNWFSKTYGQIVLQSMIGENTSEIAKMGPEIHALSCAGKPFAGWIARDAIQECREACGGHGYLKSAGLGELRNSNDANCTYEGDNNVLIQQTSNWLLRLWSLRYEKESHSLFNTPLNSVSFILNADRILTEKFPAKTIEQVQNPNILLQAYKWLICYLLDITSKKVDNLLKLGIDQFTAKNDSQVYYARTLSLVYIEHFIIQNSMQFAETEAVESPELKDILLHLVSLFGIWSLYKHISILYQGGYISGEKPALLIQDAILTSCRNLKPNAVSLADGIAPPDFILNSTLGKSDGQVYKNLEESMFNNQETFSCPLWWNEIKNVALNSKL